MFYNIYFRHAMPERRHETATHIDEISIADSS